MTIHGHKTKIGVLGMALSGVLLAGSAHCPAYSWEAPAGLALAFMGYAIYGIWSRLCWIFYKPAEGGKKPNLERSKKFGRLS